MSFSLYRPNAPTATKVIAPTGSPYRADYYTDGTADDVQIQAAIDSLGSSGGSVYIVSGNYSIGATITIAADDITILGDGKSTHLTLVNSVNGYVFTFDDADFRTHVIMEKMTIDGNQANQSSGGCIKANATVQCIFRDLHVTAGKDYGIDFLGKTGGIYGHNNLVTHCLIDGRCGIGIRFSVNDENDIFENTINDFVTFGVYDQAGLQKIVGNTFTGITSGTGIGFKNLDCSNSVISNNIFDNMMQEAIYIKGADNIISGNRIYNPSANSSGASAAIFLSFYGGNLFVNNRVTGSNHSYAFQDESSPSNNTLVGNSFDIGTSGLIQLAQGNVVLSNGRSTTVINEQLGSRMKNTSGGQLVNGDVVILKSVAAGDEITTTTTQGDDHVFGMVTETIENNVYGNVQRLGKVVSLKVDGTTDIAVGDYLATFTTAKIACKATVGTLIAVGDTAFAIALEAYTANDSSGVIDALLITPRKI